MASQRVQGECTCRGEGVITGRLFRIGPTARPRYRASVPSGAVVVSPTRARESLATGSPIHWPTHSGGTNGQRSFAVSRLCARQASQRGLRASILGPQNRLPMTGLCAANATAMKREPRRSKRGPGYRVASKRGIAPRGQRQQDPPRSQESLAFLCPSTARIDRLRQARIRRTPAWESSVLCLSRPFCRPADHTGSRTRTGGVDPRIRGQHAVQAVINPSPQRSGAGSDDSIHCLRSPQGARRCRRSGGGDE